MGTAVVFSLIASSALVIGAAIGAYRRPSAGLVAVLLAFASGALITAVAFELFEDAFEHGGAWPAGGAFLAGAAVFVAVDTWLDRRKERRMASGSAVGWALLAAVTLDGIPENLAMGVSLVASTNATLLVAIFASNLPEAIAGATKMREDASQAPRQIMLIWTGTAVLLALAVIVGYGALEGVSGRTLAWPLGFAAGAVLASLADTLMPEAYKDAREDKRIALATALGFLLSFLVSAG
ncbi:MAG: zinc permease [Solirubrobacterales bacterium]|jgi:ZIP family zinc transporter|nr:zinc permease [Solirubrobacterales bacterium]